jgi:hypothetical protein
MKPAKKKMRPSDHSENDEFLRKPIKKAGVKRDRKPSIYNPIDEEEDVEDLDLFKFDLDAMDEDEDDL